MSNHQSHLSEQDIMSITQNIFQNSQLNSFLKLKKFIIHKKHKTSDETEFVEKHFEHLKNCSICLFDVWDSYLSAAIVHETASRKVIPRIHLKFDYIKSAFQTYIDRGFLLPVSLTPATSVRSNIKSDIQSKTVVDRKKNHQVYISKAVYMLIIPIYTKINVKLEIASSSKGLKLSLNVNINTDTKNKKVFNFSLYKNKQLLESQSASRSSSDLIFFIEYEDNKYKNRYKKIFSLCVSATELSKENKKIPQLPTSMNMVKKFSENHHTILEIVS